MTDLYQSWIDKFPIVSLEDGLAAQDAVTALVRAGVRSVTLRIGDAAPVAVRLGDVDPWGAVRVQATSPPPWPDGPSDDAAAERDVDSRSLGAVTG